MMFDSDLDIPRHRTPSLTIEQVSQQQRLVANPLLPILAWIAAIVLIRLGVRSLNLVLFLSGVALALAAFCGFQYHCLDCGRIGWFLRVRNHACPPLVDRCLSSSPARTGGIRIGTQIIFWLFLVATALGIFLIWYTAQH